jgi:hypothetical protein
MKDSEKSSDLPEGAMSGFKSAQRNLFSIITVSLALHKKENADVTTQIIKGFSRNLIGLLLMTQRLKQMYSLIIATGASFFWCKVVVLLLILSSP